MTYYDAMLRRGAVHSRNRGMAGQTCRFILRIESRVGDSVTQKGAAFSVDLFRLVPPFIIRCSARAFGMPDPTGLVDKSNFGEVSTRHLTVLLVEWTKRRRYSGVRNRNQ